MDSSLFLIQYLRTEADLSDEKAQRLRAQADALVAQYGADLPHNYALGLEELPPLDEHGVPKYKGRKRGRKKKMRKRQHDPAKPKRQHTAYTLFVQETYPTIKAQYVAANAENSTAVKSNQLISIVARQWGALTPQEKEEWKQRALASAILDEEESEQQPDEEEDVDDDEQDEASEEEEEENYGRKKRGRPRKK